MSRDRGSVTIWVLGLSVLLLFFGGVALDFWRVLAVQRQAAAIADTAVVAAASGIDEAHYRETGEILIDPDRAVELATASITNQEIEVTAALVTVSPDGTAVEVEVSDEIRGGFVAFFSGDDGVLAVTATATAEPRLVP
ncbi:MAG: hypothetical protein DWQ40_04090 [Actinobacteria bacterium]|nr:MAG: hypothetical protein DWQ40_04090 [Actinomycetota bacterium]